MWNPLIWILLFGFFGTQQAVPNKGTAAIDSYGKLIEAKNSSDGKKIAQTDDGIQFEVPNYASGIVVPKPYNDLLPPLTSSEKLEDGRDDSDIVYIGNFGGTSNNIRDGKSIGSYQKDYTEPIMSSNFPIKGKTSVTVEESIEVPYTDLNPPHFVENTERMNIPLNDGNVYKGGFGGPSGILGNQESVGTYHKEKNVATNVNSGSTDLISPPLSDDTVKKTGKYDGSNAYKGGFGGPSGILGNQESVGTYHQEKNVATVVNSGLTDLIPQPLSDDTVKKTGKYDSNVYKGGFGGPSGILGNQESIGSYHQQKNIATINAELTDLKPPLSDPGITRKVAKNTDELLYDGDIYKGGFGGSSGVLGNQELVGTYHRMKTNIESDTLNPISISDNNPTSVTNFIRPFSSSTENSVYNGDIYRGGFGGPPGLLGEQKIQGTFHQNQDNEKQNKIKEIINETENIKVIQLHTTVRPSNKIVSRFEFSSIQKPNSNTNKKKDDVKKHTAKIDTTSSSTINPPSIDLLPPTDKHELDKSTEKSVSYSNYNVGLGSGIRKPVGNYYETEEPENIDVSTTPINDIKITQNEEITTEITSAIDIDSKGKTQEIIPINLKNEAITPPSVDLIPPLVDSISIQETTTAEANTITEQNNEITKKKLTGFYIKNIKKPDDSYKKVEDIEHNTRLTDSNLVSVTTKGSIAIDDTDKNTEKPLYEGDIYKGGFGGSDGFLGEQKSLGTYHQEKMQEISTTTIAYKDTTFYSPNEESTTQDFTISSSNFNDGADRTTENSLYEGDIYKGGFGGPEGFLNVQKSLGSSHQKKNQEMTDTTIAYEDTIHHSQNEESNTEGFTISSNINNDDEADKITEKSLYEGDIYKGKFGGSAGFLGEQKLLGTYHQENPQLNVNEAKITVAPIVHEDMTLNSQSQETNTQDFTISSNIRQNDEDEGDKITEKSVYESDIYKGGFGGPAGYLGEQKSLGTFHQERKQENVNEPNIAATTIAYKDTTYHSQNDGTNTQDFKKSSNIPNLISDIPSIRVSLNVNVPPEVNTKSFLSSPITAPTLSLHSTTPEPPSIYFTPPFYSPKPEQEQTLLIQKGIVPSYSPFSEQPPTVFDQRFNNNQKIDYVNDFVFADKSNNFSPPQQQTDIVENPFNAPSPLQNNQQVFTSPEILGPGIDNPNESAAIPINTINNLETVVVTPNKNSFGNIQGFNPQFLSSFATNSNNKFTGNFGGAAGILGNQKQPGYGVQPQPLTESAIATIIVSNNKYSGGFGGPPGILSPFDNAAIR